MKTLFLNFMIAATLIACTSTAPQFDLAAAKKEIETANRALSDYMAKGDSVALASAYSTDGALMLNNMPAVKGKENLTTLWGSFINAGGKYLVLWKKENGKWKLHRDISNSDLPVVTP